MIIRQHSFHSIARMAAALLAGGSLLQTGGGTPAHADVFSYSSEPRQVKACVLVSSAATVIVNNKAVPENATPYVFYEMDQRTDFKPAGWSFVNPIAPSIITADMVSRWNTRGADLSLDPTIFAAGAPLSKNMGAYWEVNLDNVSSDDLDQFDIVLMAYKSNSIQFSADERVKLRRYLDAGGTLWLEDEGGMQISPAAPFVVDLLFGAGGGIPTLATQHHPLVNFPFSISNTEVQGLGAGGVQEQNTSPSALGTLMLTPVVLDGANPMVSAADFGAGHLVVSSASIATGISGFVPMSNGKIVFVGSEPGNSGAISGTGLQQARPVDLKFGYNVVAWTTSVPTAGVNARRTGGTSENIGSQLARKWATVPVATTNPGSGAVIHKGVVFYVDGNNVLHAYDANPQQDLDGDGNPDDGIADFINGTPFDEIWNVNLVGVQGITTTTRISTPTIVSVNNGGVVQDLVLVFAGNGVTLAYNAFPSNNGKLATTSPLMWQYPPPGLFVGGGDLSGSLISPNGSVPLPAPSPVYSEGIVFTLSYIPGSQGDTINAWRVAALDPRFGTIVFSSANNPNDANPTHYVAPFAGPLPATTQGGPVSLSGLPSAIGPISAGYIKDNVSGAIDKVIYVPSVPLGSPATGGAGLITGAWFGAKDEPMISDDNSGSTTRFTTITEHDGRTDEIPWYLPPAPAVGQIDLRPVLHKRSVDPVTGAVTWTTLNYPGDFTVTYEETPPQRDNICTLTTPLDPTRQETLYADYTLDWSASTLKNDANTPPQATTAEMARITSRHFTLFNPVAGPTAPTAPNTLLTGAPALTPQDYLVFMAGDLPAADRVYAVHDQYSSAGYTGAPKPLGPAVAWMFYPFTSYQPDDLDPNLTIAPPLPSRLVNSDPFSPLTPSPAPDPVIPFDFEAVGSPAYANGVVYVVGWAHMKHTNGPAEYNATIIMAFRANPNTTFSINQALPANTQVVLKQLDLTRSTKGQPVYILLNEGTNFTLDRDTGTFDVVNFKQEPNGDAFNIALPFYVQVGGATTPAPVINPLTGFGAMDNLLWWMAIPFPVTPGSTVPPLPAEAAGIHPASGPSVIGSALYFGTMDGRIASIDLQSVSSNGGQTFVYNGAALRVHSQAALTDPNLGTPVTNNPIIHAPVGSANIVVVGATQGLTALDNQLTLIGDNHRLLEVDAAGNAVWSLDSTQTIAVSGGTLGGNGQLTSNTTSMNRPSVATRYSLNEFIVADTGNNRVLQTDRGGNVIWELHGVLNDMKFLRPGDPLTLNQPTDVQTYAQTLQTLPTITNPNVMVSPGVPLTFTTNSNAGPFYFVHYLIADSGNYRILEVADIFDSNGNPVVMQGSDGSQAIMQRQLVFVSRSTTEQNHGFRYRTVQQFTMPMGGSFQTLLISAVDNMSLGAQAVLNPTQAGSIIGSPPNPVNGPGGSLVVIPRYTGNAATDGVPSTIINSIAFANAGGTITGRQPLVRPTWFKEYVDGLDGQGNPQYRYLLADANGCYVLKPSGGDAVVVWMLKASDYFNMTGRRLQATCIQKLAQADFSGGNFYPHFLITNGYTGRDNVGDVFPSNVQDGEVHGEVFEIRSADYFANGGNYNGGDALYTVAGGVLKKNPNSSIVWMVPGETLPPGPGIIQRQIGSATGSASTYLIEQPTYSERPF